MEDGTDSTSDPAMGRMLPGMANHPGSGNNMLTAHADQSGRIYSYLYYVFAALVLLFALYRLKVYTERTIGYHKVSTGDGVQQEEDVSLSRVTVNVSISSAAHNERRVVSTVVDSDAGL
jgi:hypothetical protein